ncbi:MAG: retropepsin-like domain-containing protein [Planctomycetes bacterium]|nr:retropepsin-like domain-containing protein [Planctomycetota bacterium]
MLLAGIQWIPQPPVAIPDAPKVPHEFFVELKIPRPQFAPTVPITVFGETHFFLIDTGCTVSIFDERFKERLGPPLQTWARMQAAGESKRMELFRAPEMTVGQLRLPDSGKSLCVDFSRCRDDDGKMFFSGILGLDILRHLVVQIDLERGLATLTARAPEGLGPGIPMRLDKVPWIAAEIPELGTMQIQLDTGALRSSAITMQHDHFDALCRSQQIHGREEETIWSIQGFHVRNAGTLDCIRIQKMKFESCRAARWHVSSLGWGFFNQCRKITLDFPRKRLFLSQNSSPVE